MQYKPVGSGGVKRFNIPPYRVGECLHGYVGHHDTHESVNATQFPQSVTLASSFDTDLLRRIGKAIGTEARALRNQNDTAHITCWAPQINIVRDPRKFI